MNGIVAVAAMLRAALGVHEIRAHRSLSLSLSLSLSSFLSSSFTFYLSLYPSFWTFPAPFYAPTHEFGSPYMLFTPSRYFANRNSLQGGQRYYHEFT